MPSLPAPWQRRQRAGQLRHLACRAVERVGIGLQITLVPREQEPALARLGIEQGREEPRHGVQQGFGLHGLPVGAPRVRPVRVGHAGDQQEDQRGETQHPRFRPSQGGAPHGPHGRLR